MPLGLGDVFALTPDPGVVDPDDHARKPVLLESVLEEGMEQSAWLPGGAGEDPVIRRPVLGRVTVEADGTGEGAFAEPGENAKSQRHGPLPGAVLGKDEWPSLGEFQQAGQ